MQSNLRAFFAQFRGSLLLRNAATLGIGLIVAQIVPLLAAPILSRIYSPDDFGLWGVFSSYLSIFALIACGRYELAIVKAQTRFEHLVLIRLSAILASVTAIAISLFVAISFFFGFTSITQFGWAAWLLPVITLLSAFSEIGNNAANALERYNLIARATIINNTVQVALRIVLGIVGILKSGLILGTLGARLVQLFYYVKSLPLRLGRYRHKLRKGMLAAAKRHYRFPAYDLPGSLLSVVSTSVPLLLFAAYYTQEQTGHFTMAISMLFLPISIIVGAIGKVYYKEAQTRTLEQLKSITVPLLRLLTVVGGAGHIAILFFVTPVLEFVLGDTWHLTGVYAEWFSLWTLTNLMFSPLGMLFLAKNRQRDLMLFNALLMLLRLGGIVFAGAYGWSAAHAVGLYSVAGAVVWILQGLFLTRMVGVPKRQIGVTMLFLAAYTALWILKCFPQL